jgi:hypothetical protein
VVELAQQLVGIQLQVFGIGAQRHPGKYGLNHIQTVLFYTVQDILAEAGLADNIGDALAALLAGLAQKLGQVLLFSHRLTVAGDLGEGSGSRPSPAWH